MNRKNQKNAASAATPAESAGKLPVEVAKVPGAAAVEPGAAAVEPGAAAVEPDAAADDRLFQLFIARVATINRYAVAITDRGLAAAYSRAFEEAAVALEIYNQKKGG
jgi:hypothetical protein